MGSTRLPGKVLLPLAGKPMVARVLERASAIRDVDEVLAAIPDLSEDDGLAEVVVAEGYQVWRGSAEDVLARYAAAAHATSAESVVRITADCPLLSPDVSARVLGSFVDCDYASNTITRTFPRGLDTEIVTIEALDLANRIAVNPSDREHVTPFIWRNPDRFRVRHVVGAPNRSAMRWTVDTPEDMKFAVAIYGELGPDFEVAEVLALLNRRPELAELNRHSLQKPVE